MMAEIQANVRAYQIPFRTVWLRRKDVIDLRISGRTPEVDNWTTADLVAHIVAYRLIGVSMQDHKRLGLGRWLRATGQEISFEEGEPLPSGTVCYDEAGQIAYFSVWPLLSDDVEIHNYERKGKVYLLREGGVARIRFPVLNHRGRPGVLGPAAALLATR
jgi:hypothetical protein